jgi:ribonuclease BN (tRNA processing enzyme)
MYLGRCFLLDEREVGACALVASVALPCCLTVLQARTSQQAEAAPLGAADGDEQASLTLTFLGTGGGPRPNPSRYGPSILVQAGGEFLGRSVGFSGDTRPSDNLIRFTQGVDVLVHSATNLEGLRASAEMHATPEQIEKIGAYSITAEQVGQVFARVRPRLAVYSHIGSFEPLVAATRKAYSGPLEGADDLMTILVGEQIAVRRPGR